MFLYSHRPWRLGGFEQRPASPSPQLTYVHTCTHAEMSAQVHMPGVIGSGEIMDSEPRPPPAGPGGPRQTAGPPTPPGRDSPTAAGPSKASGWVCTLTGAVTDQEQGGGGGSGEGEAAPVPSPAPHPTLPRDQPGPPRPSRGPSGALLSQELRTKRQLPAGRAGGSSLCEHGPLLVTSLRAGEGPFLPQGGGCWESAWGQSCRPAGGLLT